jgi:proline dehydrogenase
MTGSIGTLTEEILHEVRSAKLTKLAEHQMIKEACEKRPPTTELGKQLLKLATELRAMGDEITVDDLQKFVDGGAHAQ